MNTPPLSFSLSFFNKSMSFFALSPFFLSPTTSFGFPPYLYSAFSTLPRSFLSSIHGFMSRPLTSKGHSPPPVYLASLLPPPVFSSRSPFLLLCLSISLRGNRLLPFLFTGHADGHVTPARTKTKPCQFATRGVWRVFGDGAGGCVSGTRPV